MIAIPSGASGTGTSQRWTRKRSPGSHSKRTRAPMSAGGVSPKPARMLHSPTSGFRASGAPSFTVTISFFSLQLLEHDVELVEPLRPRALVGLDPVVDGLERVPVEPVQPLSSFVTHVDHPHLSEHPQVLRHLWLSEPEHAHQVVHRALLTAGEDVQDLPPPGLGHRVERVCRRRRSCHGRIIYPYRNISTVQLRPGSTRPD